jgi:hypothetical protein
MRISSTRSGLLLADFALPAVAETLSLRRRHRVITQVHMKAFPFKPFRL